MRDVGVLDVRKLFDEFHDDLAHAGQQKYSAALVAAETVQAEQRFEGFVNAHHEVCKRRSVAAARTRPA